eukprot:3995716-Ditylum_brightwellii.AAC.1
MLTAINGIVIQQAHATLNIAKAVTHLLNYCTTHPDAIIRYRTSGIVLHIHSDSLFMSELQARSREGRHFFLSEPSADPSKPPSATVPLNRPVHSVCKIMQQVMAYAAEAEIGALFFNTRKGKELRLALTKMGHTQLPTLVMTDNSTACGIINSTVHQR